MTDTNNPCGITEAQKAASALAANTAVYHAANSPNAAKLQTLASQSTGAHSNPLPGKTAAHDQAVPLTAFKKKHDLIAAMRKQGLSDAEIIAKMNGELGFNIDQTEINSNKKHYGGKIAAHPLLQMDLGGSMHNVESAATQLVAEPEPPPPPTAEELAAAAQAEALANLPPQSAFTKKHDLIAYFRLKGLSDQQITAKMKIELGFNVDQAEINSNKKHYGGKIPANPALTGVASTHNPVVGSITPKAVLPVEVAPPPPPPSLIPPAQLSRESVLQHISVKDNGLDYRAKAIKQIVEWEWDGSNYPYKLALRGKGYGEIPGQGYGSIALTSDELMAIHKEVQALTREVDTAAKKLYPMWDPYTENNAAMQALAKQFPGMTNDQILATFKRIKTFEGLNVGQVSEYLKQGKSAKQIANILRKYEGLDKQLTPKQVEANVNQIMHDYGLKINVPKALHPELANQTTSDKVRILNRTYPKSEERWLPNNQGVEPTGPVDAKSKQGIAAYQGSAYSAINGGLRSGNVPTYVEQHIANLDHYFNRAPVLTEAMTTYRGVRDASAVVQGAATPESIFEYFTKLIGSEVQDKGYISTSPNRAFVQTWAGNNPQAFIFNIHLAPGAKGAWIPNAGTGLYKAEQEFLLNRSAKFKVISVTPAERGSTGYIVRPVEVDVELVIPPEDAAKVATQLTAKRGSKKLVNLK